MSVMLSLSNVGYTQQLKQTTYFIIVCPSQAWFLKENVDLEGQPPEEVMSKDEILLKQDELLFNAQSALTAIFFLEGEDCSAGDAEEDE